MQVMDKLSKWCAPAWVPLFVASVVVSVNAAALQILSAELLFKCLFIPLLCWRTYDTWPRPRSLAFKLLQLGYLAAWIGDIFLVFAPKGEGYFVCGALHFLFHHCIYIWLNLAHKRQDATFWKAPYWGIPYLAYVILFTILYYGHVNLILKTECMIYASVLGSSFLTAFHRSKENKRKYWLVIIGFIFFLVSDILIAIHNFLWHMTSVQSTSILITYYIAQTLIHLGYIPDTPAS